MWITPLMAHHMRKGLALWCLAAFVAAPLTSLASDNADDLGISARFDRVSLRGQGEYDQAIEMLRNILEEGERAEDISKRAYNYLVITVWDASDKEAAAQLAEEALLLYPDLDADPLIFPPKLNSLYAEVRGNIFGSLHIESDPEFCNVFLDGSSAGRTPLDSAYVRVGTYRLVVSRSGYADYSKTLEIRPGTDLRIEDIRLSRVRNWWWWTWRVGAPVAAVVAGGMAVASRGGAEAGPGPDDLGVPPDPPGK